MTSREKILQCLSILDVSYEKEITLLDIKQKYLYFAKIYNPENEGYEDGKKYYEMKAAYDSLYDHIDLVNEEINRINSGVPDSEKVVVEEKVEEVKNETFDQNQQIPRPTPITDIQVKDRPTVFGVLMSILSPIVGVILFAILRRAAPKASLVYLIIGILGFVLNLVVYILFFPSII